MYVHVCMCIVYVCACVYIHNHGAHRRVNKHTRDNTCTRAALLNIHTRDNKCTRAELVKQLSVRGFLSDQNGNSLLSADAIVAWRPAQVYVCMYVRM